MPPWRRFLLGERRAELADRVHHSLDERYLEILPIAVMGSLIQVMPRQIQ
jgi:hypothetical protein